MAGTSGDGSGSGQPDAVAGTHGLVAERLTTAEIREELDRNGFATEVIDAVHGCLEACDLVRYAGWTPPDGQLEIRVRRVRELLRQQAGSAR